MSKKAGKNRPLQIGDFCPTDWFPIKLDKKGEIKKHNLTLALAKVHGFVVGGWVDAIKCLPANYDLCFLKVEDVVVSGWWNGKAWSGRKVPEKYKVIFWKRHNSYE